MIEKLTQNQIDQFPVYVERWMKIGLSTEPANRVVAETALRDCYSIAGLTQPKQIIWTTSPLAGCVLVGLLKNEKLMNKVCKDLKKIKVKADKIKPGASVWASVRDSVGDSVGASVGDSVGDSVRASVRASVGDSVRASVRASVWASVRASVGASVGDSVGASVRASVRDSVGDSVRASVRASVRDSVGDSVRASVWASVWASVRDSVGDSVGDSVWASVKEVINENFYSGWSWRYLGQFDAGAMAYFEYFRDICDLIKETEKAVPLWDLSKHSSWVYPYQNIAVISEKPEKISVNKSGKIHCEDGPCVLYRDGFAVYGLNGIRMPQNIVETKGQDLNTLEMMALTNVDQRREALKKIPLEKIITETKAKELDSWIDLTKAWCNYTLYDCDFGDGKIRRILRMKNPSLVDTWHFERVEDHCKTVKESLAWRMGLKKYIEPVILT